MLRRIEAVAGVLQAEQPEPSARVDQRVANLIEEMKGKSGLLPRRFSVRVAAGCSRAIACCYRLRPRTAATSRPVSSPRSRPLRHCVDYPHRRRRKDRPCRNGASTRTMVSVPSGGSAVLDAPRPGPCRARPQTVVSLPSNRRADGKGELFLQEGYLGIEFGGCVRAAHLRTPNARAEVRGTRVHVGADEQETHMRVAEGSVGLTRSATAPRGRAAGYRSTVAWRRSDADAEPDGLDPPDHRRAWPRHRLGPLREDHERAARRRAPCGTRLPRRDHDVRRGPAGDAGRRALVVVGTSRSTSGPRRASPHRSADADVPVICSSPPTYPALSMTGAMETKASGGTATQWFDFPSPEHPLSAGLPRRQGRARGRKDGDCRLGQADRLGHHDHAHPRRGTGMPRYSPTTRFAAHPRRRPGAAHFGLFLDPDQVDEKSIAAVLSCSGGGRWCVEAPAPR